MRIQPTGRTGKYVHRGDDAPLALLLLILVGHLFAPQQLTRIAMLASQGGIRVNAFVSGGLLKTLAPQRIGTKLEGITHVCDWYATWCALAGVSVEDESGKAAGLPPVDGVNLYPYLIGQVDESPRTEVFASPDVLVMEINGTKWKLFGSDETVQAVLPNVGLLPHELNCSVVNQGVCMKNAPIVRVSILLTNPN